MAIAATSCCFSPLSSSFTTRFSLSSSHRGFATSDVSICFVAPKASSNNNNHDLRSSPSSFKSSRDVQKEAVSQNKFLGRSKDEGRHSNFDGNSSRGEKGRSQSAAIKSSGMQKVKNDYMAEKKEQQIGQGNIQDAAFLNAVVKVHCIHTEPDYSLPWQKQRQYTSTSSAFMIGDGKLITNAYCVEHDTEIKVQRRGDDTKYVAKVLARGFDCELALLSVESEEFWKGFEPLRFGHLPRFQDAITVVGYPFGGYTISVTKGVVSCIQVSSYSQGSSDLLCIQIDAAIILGITGGPAFNDQGECIGVTYMVHSSEAAKNIGFVIPSTVLWHFLKDYVSNEKYTGFPCLGVLLQNLINPPLRACLRVESNEGVLVRRVEPTADAYNALKEGDVIVSFDDVRVGCFGTVPFQSSENIAFSYLVSQKFAGDVVELGIIRAGSFMKVNVTLNPRVYLVPYHIDGGQPSYFVFAGLVFTHLTEPLIEEVGEESLGSNLMTKARYSSARFKGEQIVILSLVLAYDVNVGYEDLKNQQVLKFNGTWIKNLHHLSHLVFTCKNKYLVFEFEDNYIIVLEEKAATAASLLILRKYGIPSERSSNLMKPYVDPLGGNQSIDHGSGESHVYNEGLCYDGLLWA